MGLITFLPQWVLLDVDWNPQEVFAVDLNDRKVCPGPGMEATNLYEEKRRECEADQTVQWEGE